MARMNKYPVDVDVKITDTLLGSSGGITKNYHISDVLALASGAVLGYRSYTALLTQTGSKPPVATVLANNLPGILMWGFEPSNGLYTLTSNAGIFKENKTIVFVNCGKECGIPSEITWERHRDSMVSIYTNGTHNLLNKGSFEIRVYE